MKKLPPNTSQIQREGHTSIGDSAFLGLWTFLDTHVSLAPTHVRPSVGWSYFRISILLASLVALHEKLKKAGPNYLSILDLNRIS